MEKIIYINDKATDYFWKQQILDQESRYFGGIIDQKTGIPTPTHTGTGSVIATWVCSYLNSRSKYFKNAELEDKIHFALNYMLDQQHEDGTISPGWTNYHSPPDTAFLVTGLSQVYKFLKSKEEKAMSDKVEFFLKRTIPAMLTGGCHTPNHRWVLTSALAQLYTVFKEKALIDRAEAWLREGIDITEDGEWTERSNGIYNTVSNICLYHTATILDKPYILEYVRKNLDMMLYLVQPNGEIVTDYSGRQDLANTYDLSPYHLIYRLMALKDDNGLYMAMADLSLESMEDLGPVNNHVMLGYLMYPEIQNINIKSQPLPTTYERFINGNYPLQNNLEKMKSVGHHSKIEHSSMHTSFGAPVVRYRNHDVSATIMGGNTSLFSLHNGDVKLLGVKISSSFSPGIIEFYSLEKRDNSYYLKQELEKGYTGPLPSTDVPDQGETSVWYLLPHQNRKVTHNQKHHVEVKVNHYDENWELQLCTDQLKDVFYQVEFIFSAEAKLSGDGMENMDDHHYFWKDGILEISQGKNTMQIESGGHEHWQSQLAKSEFNNQMKVVKVNLVSPIDRTFVIKNL
ncbi:hypothetical protein SAMN04487943_10126 [Gracilibacillus orientalis]|uniref:Heparinase II/III-like protein n=1 Tax=Gracilibacillus orientalis TaxID=334253 RepID=A0A1I4GTU0_9BACI|nr:hypothetical protein [Gracilibacillus orientalis]SFL33438.1 hypothetical protein SAMN04487943_10126 [Gracilibacillus orientalis]